MKTVQLTKGFVALVDDADYERVSKFKWQSHVLPHTVYATHICRKENGKQTTESMHRFILGLPAGHKPDVDHRDLNGLNNQRHNLRTCTASQNQSNQRKEPGRSSQFKGVVRRKDCDRWQARIKVNKRQLHLGLFLSETDAALAYDNAARTHYGEFALCNFPPKILPSSVRIYAPSIVLPGGIN